MLEVLAILLSASMILNLLFFIAQHWNDDEIVDLKILSYSINNDMLTLQLSRNNRIKINYNEFLQYVKKAHDASKKKD